MTHQTTGKIRLKRALTYLLLRLQEYCRECNRYSFSIQQWIELLVMPLCSYDHRSLIKPLPLLLVLVARRAAALSPHVKWTLVLILVSIFYVLLL